MDEVGIGIGIYRICVAGHLDDHWSDPLGGLAIQRQSDGTTLLVGPIVDQAALHGVIARIRDLGLPLLAVDRMAESQGTTSGGIQHGGAGETGKR
jgi:hypothetical protein